MSDWIISIQSRGETKYLFLGTKVRILLLFLTVLVLFWTVLSSFLVLNKLFLKTPDQVVSYNNLSTNLITLLDERDDLVKENQTLINQTRQALELVYQQEIELNQLKKEVAELEGPYSGNFQNSDNSTAQKVSVETVGLPHDSNFFSTLSWVLSDSTENLRESQTRISTLESELVKSQNQTKANNQRMVKLLNELTDNIAVATSGIEDVLNRVDVSPEKIQNELRALYRNQNQFFADDLKMETLRSMSNSPVSNTAKNLETSLADLNVLNMGYLSLPFGDPLKGKVRKTSGYGMRNHPITGKWAMHNGVDFGSKQGTPVYATGNGVVEYVGYKGGYGKTIIIEHISGLRTIYAHLSKINVKNGEVVTSKNIIGAVGSTGLSTGPHLHYEIRRNNKAINPLIFMEV